MSPELQESRRLRELARYAILDTPTDGTFDDLTQIATRLFDVPIAVISLVDKDRVWFKSACGLGQLREIERGPGLCATAILQNNVYVSPDLRSDPSALANPLVAKANGFRFYAGAPLTSSDGYNLGAFALLDYEPRKFSPNDQEMLKSLARIVMTNLETRLASRDLIGLARTVENDTLRFRRAGNRDGIATSAASRGLLASRFEELTGTTSRTPDFGLLTFEIVDYSSINRKYGGAIGSALLHAASKRIQSVLRKGDFVGLFGSEKLLVVLNQFHPDALGVVVDRICRSVASAPIQIERAKGDAQSGGDVFVPIEVQTVTALTELSDKSIADSNGVERDKSAMTQALHVAREMRMKRA